MTEYKPGDRVQLVAEEARYTSSQTGVSLRSFSQPGRWGLGTLTDLEFDGDLVVLWDGEEFESNCDPELVQLAPKPMFDDANDPVSHPAHYNWLPKGIEVIDITENFDYCLGNTLKYILRHQHKGKPLEDLKKAQWYLARAIEKLEADDA